MSRETIEKKLEQMKALLRDLQHLLDMPGDEFQRDMTAVRAAERNFQLLVDFASDINTQILVEHGRKTPDTYRQSFRDLAEIGVLANELVEVLSSSAQLRNILVHEYDVEEDYARFYRSAKEFIPAYEAYIKVIYNSLDRTPAELFRNDGAPHAP